MNLGEALFGEKEYGIDKSCERSMRMKQRYPILPHLEFQNHQLTTKVQTQRNLKNWPFWAA
jgi:hypothetical protein